MKHLENEINNLEVLRSRGELSYMGGEKLIEFNDIKIQLENQSTWISVEDELPKGSICTILVRLESDGIFEAHYSDITEKFWTIMFGDFKQKNKVTHWMPLPKPPNTV